MPYRTANPCLRKCRPLDARTSSDYNMYSEKERAMTAEVQSPITKARR